MITLVDCGCETKVHKDGSGVEVYYCPLHQAATEMLEALKEAVKTIRSFNGLGMSPIAEKRSWEVYQYSPEMKKINAAITKAEGKE